MSHHACHVTPSQNTDPVLPLLQFTSNSLNDIQEHNLNTKSIHLSNSHVLLIIYSCGMRKSPAKWCRRGPPILVAYFPLQQLIYEQTFIISNSKISSTKCSGQNFKITFHLHLTHQKKVTFHTSRTNIKNPTRTFCLNIFSDHFLLLKCNLGVSGCPCTVHYLPSRNNNKYKSSLYLYQNDLKSVLKFIL